MLFMTLLRYYQGHSELPKEKARFQKNDRGPHLPFIIGHHRQYVLVSSPF